MKSTLNPIPFQRELVLIKNIKTTLDAISKFPNGAGRWQRNVLENKRKVKKNKTDHCRARGVTDTKNGSVSLRACTSRVQGHFENSSLILLCPAWSKAYLFQTEKMERDLKRKTWTCNFANKAFNFSTALEFAAHFFMMIFPFHGYV